MANWFYFNKSGEKVGPIKVNVLKLLAQQGVLTRETILEIGIVSYHFLATKPSGWAFISKASPD